MEDWENSPHAQELFPRVCELRFESTSRRHLTAEQLQFVLSHFPAASAVQFTTLHHTTFDTLCDGSANSISSRLQSLDVIESFMVDPMMPEQAEWFAQNFNRLTELKVLRLPRAVPGVHAGANWEIAIRGLSHLHTLEIRWWAISFGFLSSLSPIHPLSSLIALTALVPLYLLRSPTWLHVDGGLPNLAALFVVVPEDFHETSVTGSLAAFIRAMSTHEHFPRLVEFRLGETSEHNHEEITWHLRWNEAVPMDADSIAALPEDLEGRFRFREPAETDQPSRESFEEPSEEIASLSPD